MRLREVMARADQVGQGLAPGPRPLSPSPGPVGRLANSTLALAQMPARPGVLPAQAAEAYAKMAQQGLSPWAVIDKLMEGALLALADSDLPTAARIIEHGLLASVDERTALGQSLCLSYNAMLEALDRGNARLAQALLSTIREGWQFARGG